MAPASLPRVEKVEKKDEWARNAQLRFGIVSMGVALVLGVVLHLLGASSAWLLLLAPFFFVGAYALGSASLRASDGGEVKRAGTTLTAVSAAFAVAASAVLAVAQ